MFVAYVHTRSNSGNSFYDILATSQDSTALRVWCDEEIRKEYAYCQAHSSNPGPNPNAMRWKTSGLTGYYKPVTIGEYSYFYSIVEVEEIDSL